MIYLDNEIEEFAKEHGLDIPNGNDCPTCGAGLPVRRAYLTKMSYGIETVFGCGHWFRESVPSTEERNEVLKSALYDFRGQ